MKKAKIIFTRIVTVCREKSGVIVTRVVSICRNTKQQHPLDTGDVLWLRWVALSISVLFCVAILLASGCIGGIDQWHTALLQGAPFHLSEAGATAGSALSPAVSFALCIPLTLYWAAVMMYQKKRKHRIELSLLAVAALCLAGLICVLWDTVLHTSSMICSVLLTGLLVLCIPFFGKKRA